MPVPHHSSIWQSSRFSHGNRIASRCIETRSTYLNLQLITGSAPSSYQISQRMCLDTEELARRSAIYASLLDSMVASVIEELSPKDQRSRLLSEKLAIIQEAQVSAVSAGFAAASNLQLLRRDASLKNFVFQPQVLSTLRTAPFEGSHVLGPEPKVLQNRVRAMAGSSVMFVQKPKETKTTTKVTSSSRRNQSRTFVFDRLGSPAATTVQRTVTQEQPFRAGTNRGAHHRPYPEQRKKARKAPSASSAGQRWRGPGGESLGGLCPTVEESAGHLSGHQHCRGGHHFPSKTSAHPSVHQLPDQKQPSRPAAGRGRLAVERGHRAGHQRDIPRILQPTVSGSVKDRRSSSSNRPIHSQPPHGSSTLQDGNARIRPISHQKSRVDSLHRHPRRVSPCPDASSRTEASAICGQQESLPIHLSTLWIGNITLRVHQAVTPGRSAVKAARCEAACLLRRPVDPCRYSRTDSISTQGQWSASQRSWHINVLEMQAVINAVRDFLPHLRFRVVRLMCDNAVTVAYIKNQGGTRSYTLMQMTIRLLKWCDCKAITLVPVHLPGVHNIQADSLSRVGQTLNTVWTMAMEHTTRVCPVGWTTGRLVCDIRQQTTHQVCFTVSEPQGRVHGRHVSALGQREGPPVCIPPIQDGPSSAAEDRSVARSQGDSDRSTAGDSFMVSGVDGSVPRRSHPAVHRGSAAANSRRRTDRRRDRDSSLPAVKSTRLQTLRANLMTKGHSRKAAHMMSKALRDSPLQVYEWDMRFVSFCRSKRWHVFRVRSHHFSTCSEMDFSHHWLFHITRLWLLCYVIGFMIRHQATHQSFSAGTSGATQNHAQVGPSSCAFGINKTAIRIRVRYSRGILWWRHFLKMADHENCVPVSIGSYIHALRVAPGRCVYAKGNTQRQSVVSPLPEPGFLAKNQLTSQAPEWISVPGIAHLHTRPKWRECCALSGS